MNSNHSIHLDAAKAMTRKFREKKEHVVAPGYQHKNILPTCETFSREAIDQLLAQEGCKKLRIYYGMGDDDKVHAILVGVDERDCDMVKTAGPGMLMDSADDIILENATRCPDTCPPGSPLNTP